MNMVKNACVKCSKCNDVTLTISYVNKPDENVCFYCMDDKKYFGLYETDDKRGKNKLSVTRKINQKIHVKNL